MKKIVSFNPHPHQTSTLCTFNPNMKVLESYFWSEWRWRYLPCILAMTGPGCPWPTCPLDLWTASGDACVPQMIWGRRRYISRSSFYKLSFGYIVSCHTGYISKVNVLSSLAVGSFLKFRLEHMHYIQTDFLRTIVCVSSCLLLSSL